ncbi:hypothetical protein Tsubulata_016959 [Turnera subulata]|uniref:DUF4283 domain-containing protein n=1 Tax=Turnera subulata TaxID=218843 RepID=A0A9Q0G6N2_9ROSI|nr:hypothetical protein Tsubulata_016959 [Turnera subulata]
MLWPWTSSSQKLDLSSSCFPVWIKLKHIPLELLTKEGLSYLASTLGTPLHTDRDCSKLFNNDSANVCVKVDFSKPLLTELKLDFNGEPVIIEVIYSWKPLHCDMCKNWGHYAIACPSKKVVKKWIPKSTSSIPESMFVVTDVLNTFTQKPAVTTEISTESSTANAMEHIPT